MKVNIIAYGIIREVLPVSEWENEKPLTLGKLIAEITRDYPDLTKYKYILAVNNTVAEERKKLSDGDTVIFIPPFAGG